MGDPAYDRYVALRRAWSFDLRAVSMDRTKEGEPVVVHARCGSVAYEVRVFDESSDLKVKGWHAQRWYDVPTRLYSDKDRAVCEWAKLAVEAVHELGL